MSPTSAAAIQRRILRAGIDRLIPRSLLALRADTRRRQIALTFDDGPDPMTRAYLDLLDRYAISATFFVVGKACQERPDDLLEIVRRGHDLANHGFTHRRLPELPHSEIVRELRDTQALIPPTPHRPMVRPPSGSISLRSLLSCARAGFQTVMWSVDSDDCRTQDWQTVAARVDASRVVPGDIVLLHEGQSWTLDALPPMIEGLIGAGFSLVTVRQLLQGQR